MVSQPVAQFPNRAEASASMEAWLTERRIPWEFVPELALTSIDKAASLANQARLEPVVEDVVERYAADMERGDRFPPIVVFRRGRVGRVVIIGGNHRAAAAQRAGLASLAAYVVDVAGEMVLRLTYEDNRRHGLPPSEEERVFQAVHLVDCGATVVEAAQCVGLSVGKVQRGIGTAKADRRAKDLGIKEWAKLAKSVRWRLSALRSDPVFESASRLAAVTVMGTNEAYDLVQKVQGTRSDADALAVIADAEEAMAEARNRSGGGLTRQASARTKMLDALRVIAALDPAEVVGACATVDHRLVLKDRILAAARRLQSTQQMLS